MSYYNPRVIGKRISLNELVSLAKVQMSDGIHKCDIPTIEVDAVDVKQLEKFERAGGYPEGSYLILRSKPSMKFVATYKRPNVEPERDAWILDTSEYFNNIVPEWSRDF